MQKFSHNNIELVVSDDGQFGILTKGHDKLTLCPTTNHPNFELNIAGSNMIPLSDSGVKFIEIDKNEDGITLHYEVKEYSLGVDVSLRFVPGADVIIQQNTIRNMCKKDVLLTRFSSSYIESIGNSEKLPWYENEKLKLFVCNNKWQGEGQWQEFAPHQLGLYPGSTHPWERATYRITSFGSWSTGNFYPLTVVQDEENGCTWFMEIEGSHSWQIRYSAIGGYTAPNLTLEATACDEQLGWAYTLKPQESYMTERTFFGVTNGKFENAVAELLKFKRLDSTVHFDNHTIPVIFNVYMDCIWGDPRPERLLPLIDKAAEVGSEIFVIDGGWSTNNNGKGIGDWLPNEFYDTTSLSDLIHKITEKGMKAGIWTELDTVNDTALGYTLGKDAVLRRYDNSIRGDCTFYNFNNIKVREYLHSRVKALYDLGFRYIKNDYNHSVGIGPTNNTENGSPAEGAIENAAAFCKFIDDIQKEFPDLIIENCGSGALRDDNKMLRYFHTQSTSDQELYRNNVSIMLGSMTLMPPEKTGMWSYPYPAYFEQRSTFEATPEYVVERADGKETAFNMITAMFGVIFLSGRIDCCDAYNLSLIKESIKLYKEVRAVIPFSRPIYPNGMCRINEKGCFSFGMLSEKALLLGVWNIRSDVRDFHVDLLEHLSECKIIDAFYAKDSLTYSVVEASLDVHFNDKDTAGFFRIEL